jgi:hypothetical protein
VDVAAQGAEGGVVVVVDSGVVIEEVVAVVVDEVSRLSDMQWLGRFAENQGSGLSQAKQVVLLQTICCCAVGMIYRTHDCGVTDKSWEQYYCTH